MTIVVGYIPTPEGSAAVDVAVAEAKLKGQRLVVVNAGHFGNFAHHGGGHRRARRAARR